MDARKPAIASPNRGSSALQVGVFLLAMVTTAGMFLAFAAVLVALPAGGLP